MKYVQTLQVIMSFFVFAAPTTYTNVTQHGNGFNNNAPVNVNIDNHHVVNISFTQEIHNAINKIKEWGNAIKDLAGQQINNLSDLCSWMAENKIKTGLYCALMLYIYVHYKLHQLKRNLIAFDNWSLWNHLMPLEAIMEKEQKIVAEALMRDIQRHYTSAENPDDFVSPIASFLRDVEREQIILNAYITICSWLKTLYIAKVCWFDNDLYETARERVKRLIYFKSILINWVTEYKFAHHAAGSIQPNFNLKPACC